MPRKSRALRDFNSTISIAETLMKREKRYSDPPTPKTRKFVEGLRGGATILMVAAFENYLKEVVEEKVDDLAKSKKFNITKLPEKMVYHNFRQTLHLSVYGPYSSSQNLTNLQKITGFRQASQIIINGQLNPDAFTTLTRGNPNSEKVGELFKKLGIKDFFSAIKSDFDSRYGSPTAANYIPATLDSILSRRHLVAHTARALNISRKDLEDSVKFLKILADLCDEYLSVRISALKSIT